MPPEQEGPSLYEVQEILGKLPTELERLLELYCSTTPPYTPDYALFSQGLSNSFHPIFLYSDALFHSGVRDDLGVSRTFYRIVAEKKWLTEKAWRRSSEKQGPNHTQSIKLYTQFKLLMQWFGYGSEGSERMSAIYDLEYRFEHEEDPKAKEGILQKALEILSDSSTAKYFQALAAAHAGKMSTAVALCDEGIRQFPGNTPLYELKGKLLHQMAQTALCNSLHTIKQRLCRWLLLFKDSTDSSSFEFTQEDLANTLGSHRNQISRVARELGKRRIIDMLAARFCC